MRKVLGVFLSMTLAVSMLAGCGGTGASGSSDQQGAAQETEAAEPAAEETEKEPAAEAPAAEEPAAEPAAEAEPASEPAGDTVASTEDGELKPLAGIPGFIYESVLRGGRR